jgi:hypothetical protein
MTAKLQLKKLAGLWHTTNLGYDNHGGGLAKAVLVRARQSKTLKLEPPSLG